MIFLTSFILSYFVNLYKKSYLRKSQNQSRKHLETKAFSAPPEGRVQLRIQDFSLGGAISLWGGGAPTFNAATFQRKCMQKQKNWVPVGAALAVPPGSATGVFEPGLMQSVIETVWNCRG